MSHLLVLETTPKGNDALAYARRKGHRTTLLWSPRFTFFRTDPVYARALDLVDLAIEVPDLDDLDAVRHALDVAGVPEFDAVLTVLQFCVVPAARIAAAYGVRGPSVAGVVAARDKARCRAILDQHGIPNLGHRTVRTAEEALDAADALGYPVVLKPATGTGKLVTSIASDAQQVRRHFAEARTIRASLEPALAAEVDDRFIVEEMALGPMYSAEVATDGRLAVPLAVTRRRLGRDNPLLELGSTFPSGLTDAEEKELGEYCVRICAALGLDLGIFHVEVIHADQGFRLVEVNPRIGGGMVPDVIRAASDTNLFEILVDLYVGHPVPALPLSAKRAATNFFLGVTEPATVRATLPEGWFEEFRPRLESGHTSIRAGSRLRSMRGNLDRYGTIQVTAPDERRAEQDCAGLVAEMSAVLRLPFVPVAP